MKFITILSLLLLLASPVFGELTKEDLRTIIKEESAASEKRMREYIDLKVEAINARFDATNARIDGVEKSLSARIDALEKNVDDRFGAVDKKLDWVWGLMIGLIVLITAAIAVPQIIMAYRERGQKEMETRQEALQTEIQQLREQIEAQPPSS